MSLLSSLSVPSFWPSYFKYFVDNGNDGTAKSLSSKTNKCTILFPVQVTKTAANKKHDMTYEKNFNPNGIVKILWFLLRQRMRRLWLWLQQWWFDISYFNINSIPHTYSKMRTIVVWVISLSIKPWGIIESLQISTMVYLLHWRLFCSF